MDNADMVEWESIEIFDSDPGDENRSSLSIIRVEIQIEDGVRRNTTNSERITKIEISHDWRQRTMLWGPFSHAHLRHRLMYLSPWLSCHVTRICARPRTKWPSNDPASYFLTHYTFIGARL